MGTRSFSVGQITKMEEAVAKNGKRFYKLAIMSKENHPWKKKICNNYLNLVAAGRAAEILYESNAQIGSVLCVTTFQYMSKGSGGRWYTNHDIINMHLFHNSRNGEAIVPDATTFTHIDRRAELIEEPLPTQDDESDNDCPF